MDFFSIILFLLLYYIRPQEWIGFLAQVQPVSLVMAFALIAMLLRHRGLTAKDFFKTPHDWLMTAYFVWIIWSAPSARSALDSVLNLFVFYMVIVQALSNLDRIQKFLSVWALMILLVSAMALLSLYGFDPTGSYDRTHGIMKGRLVLNTSIFHNPNALGHSVVPVIPLVYFLLVWKRPFFIKEVAVPVMAVPLWCLYLTLSKGAFLAGFATAVGAMLFGRPRWVQGLVVFLALTIGWAAVQQLPRMEEIRSPRGDEAIIGRLAAWEFGMAKLESESTGVGWGNFSRVFKQENGFPKAAHSSYVQVGAELGYTGLFLFLGLLYAGLRTLVTARTVNVEEERIRRLLFVLLASYMVSSWMIDFGHRAVFFMMLAAVAAFHRHLMSREPASQAEVEPAAAAPVLMPAPALAGAPQFAFPFPPVQMQSLAPDAPPAPANPALGESTSPPGVRWRRIGWLDLVLIWLLTHAVIKFWMYVLENF